MIKVEKLTKKYGSKLAVDSISFSIEQNEVVGFLGPNGAGKSTTMNIITGYLSMTSGTVNVDGDDILDSPTNARRKIGYLPEHPALYPEMTVQEYLSFGYGIKKCRLNKKQHLAQVCEKAGISHVRQRLIKNLSKGYQQRVGIAQALVNDPPILVLDEPTVGLDPVQIIEIRRLITELGKNHTVILSSHILSEIQLVCDRILIIRDGRIVADDKTDNLIRHSSGQSNLSAEIVGDTAKVIEAVTCVPGIISVEKLSEKYKYLIKADKDRDVREDLFRRLAKEDMPLIGLYEYDVSLEQVFMQMTSDET